MADLLSEDEFNALVRRVYDALGDHDASDLCEERAARKQAVAEREHWRRQAEAAAKNAAVFQSDNVPLAKQVAEQRTRAERAEAALAGAREAALREAAKAVHIQIMALGYLDGDIIDPDDPDDDGNRFDFKRESKALAEAHKAILALISASPTPVDRADGGE